MSNFSIGEEVVCVKAHSQGLLKVGKIYTVEDTGGCCKPTVCVLPSPVARLGQTRCYACGYSDGKLWIASYLFRRKAQQSAHEEVLEKFKVEEERYDGEEKVIEPLKQ